MTTHHDTPSDPAAEMTPEQIVEAEAFFREMCVIAFMVSTRDYSVMDALIAATTYEDMHPNARALYERWDYFYGEH